MRANFQNRKKVMDVQSLLILNKGKIIAVMHK